MTKEIENGRIGSSFNNFLKEQGTYEETTEQAVKRVAAYGRPMKNYRKFDKLEESYFRNHPEEIDDYINLLEEHAKDGDTDALLSSLRALRPVKGAS